jgi:hypothetical protein
MPTMTTNCSKFHRKLLQAKYNELAHKLERSENTSGNHILQASKAISPIGIGIHRQIHRDTLSFKSIHDRGATEKEGQDQKVTPSQPLKTL